MRLLLRPEDRSDRHDRKTSPCGQVFASGGIHRAMSQRAPGQGGSTLADTGPKTLVEAGLTQMPATAWRVPGFTGPARLSRSDWLIRAFALLARSGHPALNIAVLCDCPGASRAGFYGFFPDLAAYRLEVIALWERTSQQPVLSLAPAESGAPRLALARLLELADEAIAPPSAAIRDGDPDAPCAVMIERAIRDWARCDALVAAALARVDGWRLAQVQDLLVSAGLSQRRAAERAAVFYAARLGFDRLRDSTDIVAAPPMRALALAILGGRDIGRVMPMC
ncbi:hypothetical protein M3484_09300 [Pseudomonas sp. GX19020]|uniref:hypothetical protein n=1 Tax=Pseudomonas sp. GX19020 TaxID=2942277 RepID=UPI002019EC59|nr:hypothetical protein [Pseudomonas sp. GX19020]MCL4066767.1 hypothetical protein [Pseudomonas sp. GX19020]